MTINRLDACPVETHPGNPSAPPTGRLSKRPCYGYRIRSRPQQILLLSYDGCRHSGGRVQCFYCRPSVRKRRLDVLQGGKRVGRLPPTGVETPLPRPKRPYPPSDAYPLGYAWVVWLPSCVLDPTRRRGDESLRARDGSGSRKSEEERIPARKSTELPNIPSGCVTTRLNFSSPRVLMWVYVCGWTKMVRSKRAE